MKCLPYFFNGVCLLRVQVMFLNIKTKTAYPVG